MERVVGLEKIRAKFQALEEEAEQDATGPALSDRLAALAQEKKAALEQIKSDSDLKGRQAEVSTRERLEEKFFKEKEELLAKD